MKSNYSELKKLVSTINDLNDEISFIKFNNDDGPKFKNIKEMKKFISDFENNKFDFLFEDDNVTYENNFIESFNYKKDDIFFFIYTYKKNNKYITYLSIKNLNDNDVIDNLCGKEAITTEEAHTWFDELKDIITNNNIDDIFDKLIVGAHNTIKNLKSELASLS